MTPRRRLGRIPNWLVGCLSLFAVGCLGLGLLPFVYKLPSQEEVMAKTYEIFDTRANKQKGLSLGLTRAGEVFEKLSRRQRSGRREWTDDLALPPLPPALCVEAGAGSRSGLLDRPVKSYSGALKSAKNERFKEAARGLDLILRTPPRDDDWKRTGQFHTHYLAGLVAYRMGAPDTAIGHFRRAVGAVKHSADAEREAWAGHFERTFMRPGQLSCRDHHQGDDLTSLDAYAGLVAAYLAADDFVGKPGRLAREVGDHQRDSDPMRPLLEYAREKGAEGDIPANVLWAASNLQRVYVHNDEVHDRGLGAGRAHLTFRMLDDWKEALNLDDDRGCTVLSALADGFSADDSATGSSTAGTADSVWAAVVVETFDRVSECPDKDPWNDVEGRVQHQLRALAGRRSISVGLFDFKKWRTTLEEGVEHDAVAAAEAAAQVLEEVRQSRQKEVAKTPAPEWLRAVGGDYAPEWLRAVFVDYDSEKWLRAVFYDFGWALARFAEYFDEDSAGTVPYVLALEGAAKYARRPPDSIYNVDDEHMERLLFDPILGTVDYNEKLGLIPLRYWAKNNQVRWWSSIGLMILFVAGVYWCLQRKSLRDLLTKTNFYTDEANSPSDTVPQGKAR